MENRLQRNIACYLLGVVVLVLIAYWSGYFITAEPDLMEWSLKAKKAFLCCIVASLIGPLITIAVLSNANIDEGGMGD